MERDFDILVKSPKLLEATSTQNGKARLSRSDGFVQEIKSDNPVYLEADQAIPTIEIHFDDYGPNRIVNINDAVYSFGDLGKSSMYHLFLILCSNPGRQITLPELREIFKEQGTTYEARATSNNLFQKFEKEHAPNILKRQNLNSQNTSIGIPDSNIVYVKDENRKIQTPKQKKSSMKRLGGFQPPSDEDLLRRNLRRSNMGGFRRNLEIEKRYIEAIENNLTISLLQRLICNDPEIYTTSNSHEFLESVMPSMFNEQGLIAGNESLQLINIRMQRNSQPKANFIAQTFRNVIEKYWDANSIKEVHLNPQEIILISLIETVKTFPRKGDGKNQQEKPLLTVAEILEPIISHFKANWPEGLKKPDRSKNLRKLYKKPK